MDNYVSLLHPTTPSEYPIGHITEDLYESYCRIKGSSFLKITKSPYSEIINDPEHPKHNPQYQQSELYDAIDPNDHEKIIGQGTFNVFPLYRINRRSVHLFLYCYDHDVPYILLQKRSLHIAQPGKWDVSAGGYLNAGEKPLWAAKREAKEELNFREKAYLYQHPQLYNNNLSTLFYAELPINYMTSTSTFLKPCPREVESLAWVSLEELKVTSLVESQAYFNGCIKEEDMLYSYGFHSAFAQFQKLFESHTIQPRDGLIRSSAEERPYSIV